MNNYHTHTYRCKHAKGDVEDYIDMAKLKNVRELGFSDHTPLPDDWWLSVRMGKEELSGYVDSVIDAKKKYSQMRILLGLECDYRKDYEWYYKDEILGLYPMDYLIGSIHAIPYHGDMVSCFIKEGYDKKLVSIYAELFVKAMESGLFTFMAHPDLFCLSVDGWNEEAMAASIYMLQAAKELDMPLEINCSGIRKSMDMKRTEIAYPKREFWELAGRFGIKGIVNSDAHSPMDLLANMDAGYFIQKEYGIENFVIPEKGDAG